jgi:hypothetical protein
MDTAPQLESQRYQVRLGLKLLRMSDSTFNFHLDGSDRYAPCPDQYVTIVTLRGATWRARVLCEKGAVSPPVLSGRAKKRGCPTLRLSKGGCIAQTLDMESKKVIYGITSQVFEGSTPTSQDPKWGLRRRHSARVILGAYGCKPLRPPWTLRFWLLRRLLCQTFVLRL